MDQIEGRNPVFEALSRQRRRVEHIYLDENAKTDKKISKILELAKELKVRVEKVSRRELDRRAKGAVHNGIIATAENHPRYTTASLIDELFDLGEEPFLIMADEIVYEHNLGAVLRSAMGAGANGLIIPTRRGAQLTPVVQRVSMGGAEEVPVIREGLSSSIKRIRKAGIKTVCADMDGVPYWEADLTGPIAFVMGGESKGITDTLKKRCDLVVSVPLTRGLDSLNVSVTAAILMFERVRQQRNQDDV